MRIKQGFTFNDVLLEPKYSTIQSRFCGEIDLSTELVPGVKLKYPIISSNMDTITELEMCNQMAALGGLGIIHRYLSPEEHIKQLEQVNGPKILCIGCHKEDIERLEQSKCPDAVLIDIAHGHSQNMLSQIEAIKYHPRFTFLPILAGNVATYKGMWDLMKGGAMCVKVGIGSSSICSTRLMTGNGVPQFTALMECARARDEHFLQTGDYVTIISDGGITYAGDCIKALAVGANAVMCGTYFSGTQETPGALIEDERHRLWKTFRGMSSFESRNDWRGTEIDSSYEGVSVEVPYRGPVEKVFRELINGMLSGMSYQGARNIKELQTDPTFIIQSQAGYNETLTLKERTHGKD
jgi:IMP dehydrogenase